MCPFRYGCPGHSLSGFSRQHAYPHYRLAPEGAPYFQVRVSRRTYLPESAPTPLNRLFRQTAAVSLLRPRVAVRASSGILTASSVGLATRLSLRPRLTLIRLALIRKPWSCGGGGSHPPCRYLYLHLLFQRLQRGSRPTFSAAGMLPYRPEWVPCLRQTAYTRLLSMPGSSTSELLRTLQMNGCFQANILAVSATGLR